MNGIIRKKTFLIALIIAAALSAAIFAVLYYSGSLLPKWANWKDVTVYGEDGDEPDEIILKNRRVRAYRNGECIFRSPTGCLVQDILYTDIDRDGEKELLLLNFNIGRYGDHRPFWVKRNELKWFQHIYIYDFVADENYFRPIWMASDIGMDASGFAMADKEKQVLEITESNGDKSRWMWMSFGLRCVDE